MLISTSVALWICGVVGVYAASEAVNVPPGDLAVQHPNARCS